MATYVIGDIQGCAKSFNALLRAIDFHPSRDRLWLTGDLVNRGPDSLAVLQQLVGLQDAVKVVLGNHDIHALSIGYGIYQSGPKDTLEPLLRAPQASMLLDWLRCQPLMLLEDTVGMVHAGMLPQWQTQATYRHAQQVHARLAHSKAYAQAFLDLYHRARKQGDDAIEPLQRQDVMLVRVLTYLRICDANGAPVLKFHGDRQSIPPGCTPWFAAQHRKNLETMWFFGHWAALGLCLENNTCALDTGCVWGRALTAYRIEDATVHQVAAQDGIALGNEA